MTNDQVEVKVKNVKCKINVSDHRQNEKCQNDKRVIMTNTSK